MGAVSLVLRGALAVVLVAVLAGPADAAKLRTLSSAVRSPVPVPVPALAAQPLSTLPDPEPGEEDGADGGSSAGPPTPHAHLVCCPSQPLLPTASGYGLGRRLDLRALQLSQGADLTSLLSSLGWPL